jgi:thiol-disulfide isomerase/thioredoxin
MKKWIWLSIALVGVVGIGVVYVFFLRPAPTYVSVAKPAAYVLVFRATWCPACMAFEPKLKKLEDYAASHNIQIENVDLTSASSTAASKERLKAENLDAFSDFNSTGYAFVIDQSKKTKLGQFDYSETLDQIQTKIDAAAQGKTF